MLGYLKFGKLLQNVQCFQFVQKLFLYRMLVVYYFKNKLEVIQQVKMAFG